ncbi:Zinc finger BED domain-containing protein 5 [Habropoda laboriosa]|uniref:Zinc finger BED domain-containing protein 5 n=1 Tax=Habropoda laboriosa TaxID=597456 RepID=A0A0L7QVM3_9HYME|nr:Zinc finger BED domain-containing protein 5 [Habropoda laboriosa]
MNIITLRYFINLSGAQLSNIGDRWIVRAGNYKWPARSPDLTTSNFYLWISLWRTRIIQKRRVDMFPSVQNNNIGEIIPIITQHLALLEEKITKYFPALNIENYDWIRNPFSAVNTSSYEFSLQEKEKFITLSMDRTLKMKFSEITVEEFWISVETEFKTISKKAIKILLQFSTSYLCELGFSTLTNIKTKKRERLTNIEEEMRVAISHIRPDIENICKSHNRVPGCPFLYFFQKFLMFLTKYRKMVPDPRSLDTFISINVS